MVNFLFSLMLLFVVSGSRQSLADPIEETKALLKDPVARQGIVNQDPTAKKADQRVKNLGLSPAGEARLYDLSAGIFENLAKEEGGDAEKLTQTVNDLLRDPASLEKKLTPEQKREIHNLSKEIESRDASPLMAH